MSTVSGDIQKNIITVTVHELYKRKRRYTSTDFFYVVNICIYSSVYHSYAHTEKQTTLAPASKTDRQIQINRWTDR